MKKNGLAGISGINKISLILIVFLSLSFMSCKTSLQKKVNGTEPYTVDQADTSLLFDGKSLNGWSITNFGPQGDVYVSNGQIVLGMGDGCTGITWQKEFPENNYKITLEAKRISGTDFFCGMTFPAGKEPCTLIVGGWGGTVVGLSSIDGYDAAENETTVTMVFENDQWYNICLMVKQDSIRAWINRDLIVDFKKGDRSLSVRPEVELSRPFGIASWNTTAALRNIKLELIK